MKKRPREYIQAYPITYRPPLTESEADEPDSCYREASFYYQRYRRGEDIQTLRGEIGITHETLARWQRIKKLDGARFEHDALVFRCKVSELFEKLILSQADPKLIEKPEEPRTLAEDGLLCDKLIRRKLRQIKPFDGLGKPVSINRLAEILGILMEKDETPSHFKHRVLVAELQRECAFTPPAPNPTVRRVEKLSPFLKTLDKLEGLAAEASTKNGPIDAEIPQQLSSKETEALILSLDDVREAPIIHHETAKERKRKAALEKVFDRVRRLESKIEQTLLAADRCPNCGGKIKEKATYCSPTCALVYAANQRRKVDPEKLAELNKVEWLSRQEIADFFGVKTGAINSAIFRHKLSRLHPTHCRIPGCEEPVRLKRHVFGYLTGTMCKKHNSIKNAEYTQKYRRKTHLPKTSEERKQLARKASMARWSKAEWADQKRRSEFGRMVGALRNRGAQGANQPVQPDDTSQSTTASNGG
jgi:hypothetical protein